MSNYIFPNTTGNDIINFVEYTIPQIISKKVNIDKYKEIYKKCNKYDMLSERIPTIFCILCLVISVILLIVNKDLDEVKFIIQYLSSMAVLLGILGSLRLYFICQYSKYHKLYLTIKQPILELFEDRLYINDSELVFASLLEPEHITTKDTISGFESIFIIDKIKHILESVNNSDTISINISMNDDKTIVFDILVNDISYKQYTIDGPIDITEFNKLTKNIKSTNTYDFTYLDDRFNAYHKFACDVMEKLFAYDVMEKSDFKGVIL